MATKQYKLLTGGSDDGRTYSLRDILNETDFSEEDADKVAALEVDKEYTLEDQDEVEGEDVVSVKRVS